MSRYRCRWRCRCRCALDEMGCWALGDGITDQKFGSQSDSGEGFINRTCPVSTHPPPSATTTATAPATTSSVTPAYCMEESPTLLPPHINEPPRQDEKKRPPSKPPQRPSDNLEHSKDIPKPSNALNLDAAGGRATPSTPRSASPDSRANDSSTPRPRRETKPKPRPNSTPDVRDSKRNPIDAKPSLNKPDSRQWQSQGKLDGGTTDASDSKPPRRRGNRNKTAHASKETNVNPETANDSADAKPPSLGRDPPRRRKQGKVDGKLTTGDVEPRQEERHVNPNREKYRVDRAADDLTSRLIRDLRTPPYLDCAICFNPIRPHERTWSCSPSTPVVPTGDSQHPQYCWVTLHLKCIRSWALKSIADLREAHKARGEDKPGEWLCTGCRAKRTIEPSSYMYALCWSLLIWH